MNKKHASNAFERVVCKPILWLYLQVATVAYWDRHIGDYRVVHIVGKVILLNRHEYLVPIQWAVVLELMTILSKVMVTRPTMNMIS